MHSWPATFTRSFLYPVLEYRHYASYRVRRFAISDLVCGSQKASPRCSKIWGMVDTKSPTMTNLVQIHLMPTSMMQNAPDYGPQVVLKSAASCHVSSQHPLALQSHSCAGRTYLPERWYMWMIDGTPPTLQMTIGKSIILALTERSRDWVDELC
jgi:hypothetical protein